MIDPDFWREKYDVYFLKELASNLVTKFSVFSFIICQILSFFKILSKNFAVVKLIYVLWSKKLAIKCAVVNLIYKVPKMSKVHCSKSHMLGSKKLWKKWPLFSKINENLPKNQAFLLNRQCSTKFTLLKMDNSTIFTHFYFIKYVFVLVFKKIPLYRGFPLNLLTLNRGPTVFLLLS